MILRFISRGKTWQKTLVCCICVVTAAAANGAEPAYYGGQRQGTFAAHYNTRPADSPFAALQTSGQCCPPYGQPCAPGSPYMPAAPIAPSPDATSPDMTTPGAAPAPMPTPDQSTAPMPAQQPQFNFAAAPSGLVASARSVSATGGYIDPAIVGTQLRFRYDAAYDFNVPDRAEYYYSTWTAFGGQTPVDLMGPNNNLDFQAFKLYYEQSIFKDLSAFIQAPIIFNNPSGIPGPGPNTSGVGDLQAGFKLALYESETTLLTFQLKNYIARGARSEWLTAGHASIEPGLLFLTSPAPRWAIEGEIRDWIPIQGAVNPNNGQDYAGNVLRYGLGASYAVVDNCNYSVSPVMEFVGWSVLDGQKLEFNSAGVPLGPSDAGGDTIVNGKFGVRVGFGQQAGPQRRRDSVYIGYGRSLTGDRWYKDILRVEYRMFF